MQGAPADDRGRESARTGAGRHPSLKQMQPIRGQALLRCTPPLIIRCVRSARYGRSACCCCKSARPRCCKSARPRHARGSCVFSLGHIIRSRSRSLSAPHSLTHALTHSPTLSLALSFAPHSPLTRPLTSPHTRPLSPSHSPSHPPTLTRPHPQCATTKISIRPNFTNFIYITPSSSTPSIWSWFSPAPCRRSSFPNHPS